MPGLSKIIFGNEFGCDSRFQSWQRKETSERWVYDMNKYLILVYPVCFVVFCYSFRNFTAIKCWSTVYVLSDNTNRL